MDEKDEVLANTDCNPDTKFTMQSCNDESCPIWVEGDWTGVSHGHSGSREIRFG